MMKMPTTSWPSWSSSPNPTSSRCILLRNTCCMPWGPTRCGQKAKNQTAKSGKRGVKYTVRDLQHRSTKLRQSSSFTRNSRKAKLSINAVGKLVSISTEKKDCTGKIMMYSSGLQAKMTPLGVSSCTEIHSMIVHETINHHAKYLFHVF